MLVAKVASVGLASVVGQCICLALGFSLWFAALSPFHAFCCLVLLALQDPRLKGSLRRFQELQRELAGKRAPGVQEIMSDPTMLAAAQLPPFPAPWSQTAIALGCMLLADVSAGLMHACRVAAWALPHDLAVAAAAVTLIYGVRRDSAAALPVSSVVRATCWVGVAALGAHVVLDEHVRRASGALPPADALSYAAAARTLACAALLGTSAVPLLATCARSGRRADQPRLALLFGGAVALVVPATLPLLLPGAKSLSLALCCERLAEAAVCVAALALEYPPDEPSAGWGDDYDDLPEGAPQSIGEMAAARRRARLEAERDRPPAPEPLLRDSWSNIGGVQGLGAIDAALEQDDDGKQAPRNRAAPPAASPPFPPPRQTRLRAVARARTETEARAAWRAARLTSTPRDAQATRRTSFGRRCRVKAYADDDKRPRHLLRTCAAAGAPRRSYRATPSLLPWEEFERGLRTGVGTRRAPWSWKLLRRLRCRRRAMRRRNTRWVAHSVHARVPIYCTRAGTLPVPDLVCVCRGTSAGAQRRAEMLRSRECRGRVAPVLCVRAGEHGGQSQPRDDARGSRSQPERETQTADACATCIISGCW